MTTPTPFLRCLLLASLLLSALSALHAESKPLLVSLRVISLPKATASLLLGMPNLRTQPARSIEILDRLLSEKKATLSGVLATQTISGQRSAHSNAHFGVELDVTVSRDGAYVDLVLAFQEAPKPGNKFPGKIMTGAMLPRIGSQILGAFESMDSGPDGPTQIVVISLQ